MRVILLEPEPQDFPSLCAYSMARYSRSAASIEEIWTEVEGKEAAERLSRIFHGYGHASVAGMAHQAVALEGVSILESLRFFYVNVYGDGQERSTRYQSQFYPYVGSLPTTYAQAYQELIHSLLVRYHEAKGPVMAILERQYPPKDEHQRKTLLLRTLDCTRYLLPLGVQTSLGQVQSARSWRDYLKQLATWNDQPAKELYNELSRVLQGSGIRLLVKYIEGYKPEERQSWGDAGKIEGLQIDQPSWERALVEQEMSLAGQGHRHWNGQGDLVRLGTRLGAYDHHHHGRFWNTGTLRVRGYADLGTVKDLNRHRSLERFIPFLEEDYQLEADLAQGRYEVPPYPDVERFFQLDAYYDQVREFFYRQRGVVDDATHAYYTKCLLPQAHQVAYCYYGSPADLSYVIQLRIRPGGHRRYREEVNKWAEQLKALSAFWSFLPELEPETPQTFYQRG